MRLKRAAFVGCIWLVIICGCLVVFELGVRFWGYSKIYIYDPVYQPFPGSADIPYIHKFNLVDATGFSDTRFSTDAQGLRTDRSHERLLKKKPNEFRIAVLGDSVTFGQGVETSQTFAVQLENRLNRNTGGIHYTVLNFAVCGYSVKEMEATFQNRVIPVQPDLVLFCMIYSDFNLSRAGIVDKHGYLHNQKLISYRHPDATLYYLLRRIHAWYLIRDVVLRVKSRWLPHDSQPAGPTEKELPASIAYVEKFARSAERSGISYYVVTLPSIEHDGSEHRLTAAYCRQHHIRYFDLAGLRKRFTYAQYRVTKRDGHPSALVHAAIAEALFQRLGSAVSPAPSNQQRPVE
jgi:hypothetical protein